MSGTNQDVGVTLKLKDQASGRMKKARSSIVADAKGIAKGFVAATASVAAFKALVIDSVRISAEHEKVMTRLKTAGFQNVKAIDAQAEAMQRQYGISSDLIANQIAVGKALGQTEQQSIRYVRAAIDGGAELNRNWIEIHNQLNKTLGGTFGELSELVPSIKSLTAEELRAGGAADFMLSKFEGSAGAQAGTKAGRMSVIHHSFLDLKQAVGDFILTLVEIPDGTSSKIDAITDSVNRSTDAFNNGRSAIEEWLQRQTDALGIQPVITQGIEERLAAEARNSRPEIVPRGADGFRPGGLILGGNQNVPAPTAEQFVAMARAQAELVLSEVLSNRADTQTAAALDSFAQADVDTIAQGVSAGILSAGAGARSGFLAAGAPAPVLAAGPTRFGGAGVVPEPPEFPRAKEGIDNLDEAFAGAIGNMIRGTGDMEQAMLQAIAHMIQALAGSSLGPFGALIPAIFSLADAPGASVRYESRAGSARSAARVIGPQIDRARRGGHIR